MTVAAEQNQRSFQFQKRFGPLKSKRYFRQIGLGFDTPISAKNSSYVDKKCPFTGDVSIRGKIMNGQIQSMKMTRTIILRKSYMFYLSKYKRFEKRHKNFAAHLSPAFEAYNLKKGDRVTVGECRPLSKTVRFNVIAVDKSMAASKKSKVFSKF
ncbi:MAG: 40S ribosomal protein S11-B [Marteilia pararefringens]